MTIVVGPSSVVREAEAHGRSGGDGSVSRSDRAVRFRPILKLAAMRPRLTCVSALCPGGRLPEGSKRRPTISKCRVCCWVVGQAGRRYAVRGRTVSERERAGGPQDVEGGREPERTRKMRCEKKRRAEKECKKRSQCSSVGYMKVSYHKTLVSWIPVLPLTSGCSGVGVVSGGLPKVEPAWSRGWSNKATRTWRSNDSLCLPAPSNG